MKNAIHVRFYETAWGPLLLGSFGGRLCLCDWWHGRHRSATDHRLQKSLQAAYEERATDVTEAAVRQLDEYFAGQRIAFDLPLLPVGTDFQRAVWSALMQIPYGATCSYGELAARMGRPKAVRAVANANGANPLSVIVPCHRVTGSDNTLTGYGGGLVIKEALLTLEAEVVMKKSRG